MKIFITGATGFIGSHLTALLAQEHTVHSMTSNLLDFDAVSQELHSHRPDIIVHLAARTEVEKSFYEQVSFSQVNYVGTVNLIEAAKTLPALKNFVFASTMEVYGWQPISSDLAAGRPFQPAVFDEHTAPAPNAPYAVAKYACEKYLEYMHRSQGFPFTAIRQTNSYGRRDNDFFVTEQIISQMLQCPDQIFLGHPDPWRNFIFIDDLLAAWQCVITNPDLCQGKIFTIGPNNPIRIADYAQMIASKLNWQGKIVWHSKPKRHGEIFWLNSNSALIEQTLGWKPCVSLDQGLDRTIDIWRSKLIR